MNESRSFPDGFGLESGSARPLIDRRDTHYLARRADFVLGNARVRPSVRTIEGPSGSSTAEPRVMQVLVTLADAGGSVVTRDDLIHDCWKGMIVGDDSINRAIKEVRRIIRTTGADFEVQTIPRIGFRLDAGSTPAKQARPVEAAVAPEPAASTLSRRTVVTGTAAIAAAGLAVWVAARRSTGTDAVTRMMEDSRIALRTGDAAQERRAVALLEQAVAADPERADAWGLLALTRARLSEHVADASAGPVAAINDAAERALKLDPDNADASAALAIAIPYYGDWYAAERRFDAVIARHADDIYARDARSFLLGAVGRMRESAEYRLAFTDRAPLDANLQFRLVYALWFLDRIAEADRVAARGLEMWPAQPGLWFARLWLLCGTGRIDRALAQVDDKAARPPLPAPMFMGIRAALVAAQSHDPAAIEAAATGLMGGVSRNVAGVVNAMMLLNLMGATDRAFALADAYYLERGPVIAAMQWRPGQPVVPDQRRRKTNMLFTPLAAPMWRDPRFMPLTRDMGLADYWNIRGVRPDFLAMI
ncbi:winged helix-turn-helix domain-containing protein [Croceicoccus sp. Ery15]|uniref:winged helix-turn-helix domain-containing protein n=1 Tax=Croceicoccus sp. Ery15 TaxID=1703338 RepID=UPI001E2D34EA|nr:winged helix-turn-helix domain-containing protein [Croceicoccus sp. Ery15]